MECERCQRRPPDVALYRVNPKGEKGRWRCDDHMNKPVDPAVQQIVDVVRQPPGGAAR